MVQGEHGPLCQICQELNARGSPSKLIQEVLRCGTSIRLVLGDRSPWVSCVSACLTSRSTDCLCSGPSFPGCLYSKLFWKREIMYSSGAGTSFLIAMNNSESKACSLSFTKDLGSLSAGFTA